MRAWTAIFVSAAALAAYPQVSGAVSPPASAAAPMIVIGPAPAFLAAGQEGDSGPRSGTGEAPRENPSELAIEATRKLMQAIQLLFQSLPQYGAPYINENGDIVIPRLKQSAPRPEPKPPAPPDDHDHPGRTVL